MAEPNRGVNYGRGNLIWQNYFSLLKQYLYNHRIFAISFLTVLLFASLLYFINAPPLQDSHNLTVSEKKLIQKYVDNVRVEDAVGQLFVVGIPADYKNYVDAKELHEILTSLGIGGVIINAYNYYNPGQYDDDTFLQMVISFNNSLQEKAVKHTLGLPLLVVADFESYRFTSIKHALLAPPSALSLGVSQDPQMLSLVGKLVGVQLTSIGINTVLGPVLDSYNVKQGNSTALQDRCFASTPKGVVAISSHFIKGLQQGGVSIFAKHFPSHGTVEENPHDLVIPSYDGSQEQLKSDINPFIYFKNNLDGIMTSHVLLPRINNKMATFSSEFIKEYLRKTGFSTQILITDDLSSMGAIRKYANENNESAADIGEKAFEAGHDLLLFSHFNKMDKKSLFSLRDLYSVREALINTINARQSAKEHFKEALYHILLLKAKHAKSMGFTIQELLNNRTKKSFFSIQNNVQEVKRKIHDFISKEDDIINSPNKLVTEAIRRSATLINKKAEFNLSVYRENSKIAFFVYDQGMNVFRQAFNHLGRNVSFEVIPSEKHGQAFSAFRSKLLSNFDKYNVIIYTANDKSDADLLTFLQNKKSTFPSKMIIFSHNSPIMFDINTLRCATIISTFTDHPASFEIDTEILTCTRKLKELKNLPISIGENAKYYNVSSTVFIEPTDKRSFENIFPKYQFDEKTINLVKSENFLISKNSGRKILFTLITCVGLFPLIYAVIASIIALRGAVKKRKFPKMHEITIDFFMKHLWPWGIITVVAAIVELWFFRSECSALIKAIVGFMVFW